MESPYKIKRSHKTKINLSIHFRRVFTAAVIGVLISIFCVPPAAAQVCSSGSNLIFDGGFETGGVPSSIWNLQTSTNGGTPLCTVALCGTSGGASPPRTGAGWAWFGGFLAIETATIGQTVTIPSGGTASLNFWMRVGIVSAPFTDVLNVRVDGIIQQVFVEPTVAESAYTLRTINLNAFANGAPHTILFEYIAPTTGVGSFVVDDVTLNFCRTTAASVSISGRVANPRRSGLTGARVTLTDLNGNVRTTQTQTFGNFNFTDAIAGETYILSVFSKRYTYAPKVITATEDLTDVNFAPTP